MQTVQFRDTHSWNFIWSRADISLREVRKSLRVPLQPWQLLIQEKIPERATLQQGIHLLPSALAQLTQTQLFLLPLLLVYVQSRERCSSLAGVLVPSPAFLPTSSSSEAAPEDLSQDLPSRGLFPKRLIGVIVLVGTLCALLLQPQQLLAVGIPCSSPGRCVQGT